MRPYSTDWRLRVVQAPKNHAGSIPTTTLIRTCVSNAKIYGSVKDRFPLLLTTEKPRFYVCKFGQRTKVSL